ncbi:MAG TPA: transketolase C-terminal domain-containing protein, partial [Muribaculaceae bacterium]|nr:transketolase C-terminal domain-containing protein [Muribaculaceae bacterium]
QIRLMELLDNFGGRQSTLVLRPADSAETAVAWKMAMDNKECPTVLILSRQNLEDLPAADGNRCKAAYGAQRGGYTVIEAENPELILVANGSEVALAVHAAEALAEEGRSVRVVSVPSVGLFLRQDKEYRDSVLTPGIPRYGITAGLPAALYPLMRGTAKWDVFGLEHFGASAPYKVLDEKFGFNDANVLTNIIEFIEG